MLCAVCNKESTNKRVCPFCFTPYPADAPASRASTATQRQARGGPAPAESSGPLGAARAFVMRQTPVTRWAGAGIIAVLLLWTFTGGGDATDDFPTGSVPSTIIATPMQRDEAVALIRNTRENNLVEMQQDEVSVTFSAASFPVQAEGQIALAQQFARADEIVEGRRRVILFYEPSGRLFARADGVRGVTVVR